jgi:Cupin domain
MTLLTHRGEGPGFLYAGQQIHIVAGQDGQPAGFAVMEITVPPHFAGPVPHVHDEFDEAIYVLAGRLQVTGDDEAQEAVAGSMFVAARVIGTALAIRMPRVPWCWGSGPLPSLRWPSCAR